jgi:hypothetical protein
VSEDLIDWLRRMIDEDERAARATVPGPWRVSGLDVHAEDLVVMENFDEPGPWLRALPEHIARHDPARVLREVEARRRLIDQYEAMRAGAEAAAGTILAGAAKVRLGAYEMAVKIMAMPYSDRPGYREEWRP